MKSIRPINCILLLASLFIRQELRSQQDSVIHIKSVPFDLFWENNPASYTVKNNELRIVAGAKTDMFRDPNVTYNTDNAPKLLFRPDNDFVLTASIEQAFTSKWDGGALVLKQDSLNWIKFCFEKDYTGARRVVSVVTKNISDDCNSVKMASNKVFYKIAKADNVITLYYSTDGSKWFLIRHFQFDTTGNFYLGFLAQSPTGNRCEVTFSNISYKAKKIKDPYIGE
jgi:regulation of enolase protein 1 (concanavalin A-like superfamily)